MAHLLQLIDFQDARWVWSISVSISRGASERQSGRCRQDCLDRYAWGMDARST